MRKKYDFIVGIGAACSCTQVLRRADLQTASYPLDWVAGVPFEGRVDFLTNRFENFFNKEDLEPMGMQNGATDFPCDVYKNNRTGMIFNHDFPVGSDFQEMYPVVKEKYARRIDRLYRKANTPPYGTSNRRNPRLLIVYIELPNEENKLSDTTRLTDALAKIHASFSWAKTDLLYCSQSTAENLTHLETTGGEIDFWQLDYQDLNRPEPIAVRLSDTAHRLKSRYCLKMTIFKRLSNFIWKKKSKLKRHFIKRRRKKALEKGG